MAQAFTDIRGEGFFRRSRIGKALEQWLRLTGPLPGEAVPLAEAAGRCLTAALTVTPPVAGARRARQNGIALRAEQTYGASVYDPIVLPEGEVQSFSTGEPLPNGYDAVVPYAALRHIGGFVQVMGPVAPGEGVQGEGGRDDRGAGKPPAPAPVTIAAGRPLTPPLLALLAGCGVENVVVHRRPRVRLVAVGMARSGPPDQVTAALSAAIVQAGGVVCETLRPETTLEAVGDALSGRDDIDAVVAVGRTGTGPDDIAPPALAMVGAVLAHGMALRPGGSAAVGGIPQAGAVPFRPVLLLPGQPPSALVAFAMLGAALLARLSGQVPLPGPVVVRSTLLGRKLVSEPGMLDVVPVRIDHDGIAFPLGDPSQLGLAALAADGVVLIAEESEGLPAGAEVVIYQLGGSLSGGDEDA